MPIKWTSENEAKLLAGLFQVCQVKVTGKELAELAAIMGEGCTPKAITHRLAKFKEHAAAFSGGKEGKKAAAKSGGGKKAEKEGKGAGQEGKKKRAREEEAESDGEEEKVGKKVKVEDGEGEGEGEEV